MGLEGLELQRENMSSLNYLTPATEFNCTLYYFPRASGINIHKQWLKTTKIYPITVLEARSSKLVSLGLNQAVSRAKFPPESLAGGISSLHLSTSVSERLCGAPGYKSFPPPALPPLRVYRNRLHSAS